MTQSNRFTPRTKHIALMYQHFQSFVDSKKIQILCIPTEDQFVDIFRKPILNGLLQTLMGW